MIQALIDELNDQNRDYSRECAAISLGKLGPGAVQAVPHLFKVIQEQKKLQTQLIAEEEDEMTIPSNLGPEAEIALGCIDPKKFNRAFQEPGGK